MLEIISPALKRQLTIIQYLYKEKRGQVKIKELADLVKTTEATIRADLERIDTNFPSLHIETYPQSKIQLSYPDNLGVEHIYKRIMHLSLEITIFEDLLESPNRSKEFYIKKFFLSISSFRRLIKKWNEFFQRKKLDVSISIAPVVSVKGDELTIRKFYYHCLIEKYMGDFQSNFLEKNDSLWKITALIGDIFSVEISYTNHLKLSYWFYVCIQRMKHQYFIPQKQITANQHISLLLYNKINKDIILKERFIYDYKITPSVEILLNIIGIYDLDLFIVEHITRDISTYQKNNTLSMLQVKDFLLSFYKSIQYDNFFFDHTLALVYFFLTWQSPKPTPFFFYNRYKVFKEYIKKENPFLLKKFYTHLEKSNLPNHIKKNDDLKDGLLYHVIIHTRMRLDVFPQDLKSKVLILTTFSEDFMHSLAKQLENAFDERFSVSIYHSNYLSLDLEYLKQFDVILTNYNHLSNRLDNQIIYLDIGNPEELIKKLKRKLISMTTKNIFQ